MRDVMLHMVHMMHHVVDMMVMMVMDGRGLGGDRGDGERGNEREGGEETHVEGSLISDLSSRSRSDQLRSGT
jgi:hypothetical protein